MSKGGRDNDTMLTEFTPANEKSNDNIKGPFDSTKLMLFLLLSTESSRHINNTVLRIYTFV